jgi:hypothetical protein
MRDAIVVTIEYLLGFLALVLFAYLAFGSGLPSDDRFIHAFKVSAPVAVAELLVLFWRAPPMNRLILGANLWLVGGGMAAYLQQWWWLSMYQQLGEAGLFVAMAVVGLATTAVSPSGFVAAAGPRRAVVMASVGLLAAVLVAIAAAIHFRGDVRLAAVVPVIALSWINRLLRRVLTRAPAPNALPSEHPLSPPRR